PRAEAGFAYEEEREAEDLDAEPDAPDTDARTDIDLVASEPEVSVPAWAVSAPEPFPASAPLDADSFFGPPPTRTPRE
ncbi:hypothetical protein G3I76_32670, partial [Streptomyces sp. SID11233]|nr:hypothetical protein [Streptomyces sp. SID11233]